MKEEIIYGSHNSMTFLPPKHWWGYLGLWIARCQNKDYKTQFEQGCRAFDLRIYWDKNENNWGFAHGLINFKVKDDVFSVIRWLAETAKAKKEVIYVRIIFEKFKDKHIKEDIEFKYFCYHIESYQENNDYIRFIGGNNKVNWEKLYTFDNDIQDKYIHQYVSSMMPDARWYEKICPYLYAKRMNKVNKGKMKEIVNLFDFV